MKDVIIVGAGVIGSSIAFHLTQQGVTNVEVVDRDLVGSGMSGRSVALVRAHYTFGPEVDLAVRSDVQFDAWTDLVGAPPCVRRTGFVRIVGRDEEDSLRANVEMQRSYGADVDLIDAAALKEIAPEFYVDDLGLVAWEEHGGYGDGGVVARDFLAAAREAGVSYRPKTNVERLVRDGDRIVGIQTSEGVTMAEHVVVATGTWAQPLLAQAGLDLPIETEFHHVTLVRHSPGAGASICCIDSTTASYFRPEGTMESTLLGLFAGVRGVDTDHFPQAVELDELAHSVTVVSHRVPRFRDVGIDRGTTGVYDMTPDGRPILGEVEDLEGLVVAVGFNGQGFKIAPAIGETMAQVVAGQTPDVDIAAFHPIRFEQDQLISPPFAYADD